MISFADAILTRIMSVFVRESIQFYACICYIAVAAFILRWISQDACFMNKILCLLC